MQTIALISSEGKTEVSLTIWKVAFAYACLELSLPILFFDAGMLLLTVSLTTVSRSDAASVQKRPDWMKWEARTSSLKYGHLNSLCLFLARANESSLAFRGIAVDGLQADASEIAAFSCNLVPS